MDTTQLLAKFFDNALTLGAMAVAVWWLQKALSQFMGKLDSERTARLDAMDKEIERQRADLDLQRTRNDECEKDRITIHRELIELFKNNPNLSKRS
jgi:hypothetical protein